MPSSFAARWGASTCFALLMLVAHSAHARVVAIDLDLPIDQVGDAVPNIKVGDHHHARIFYDTAAVDSKTHRVKPLHMQHLVGGQWIPVRLDPVSMPMDDAWLDLGTTPYTYHYHSVTAGTITEFSDQTRRMSIRHVSDNSVIVAAPYIVDPTPVADPAVFTLKAPPPKYVLYNVEVHLDQFAATPNNTRKVGDIDKVRVVYDSSLIDPHSHHVHLVNFQHFVNGEYRPARVDPVMMPTKDAWLDLSKKPYRIHFHAAAVHGIPILIDVEETSQRLTIRAQSDPSTVMLGGMYVVDPTPVTGPEVDTAATAAPR